MRKKKLPIRWDRLAKDNLNNIYAYIAKDSVVAARKVKKELVRLAHSLNDFPEKFSNPPHEFLHLWKNSPMFFLTLPKMKRQLFTPILKKLL